MSKVAGNMGQGHPEVARDKKVLWQGLMYSLNLAHTLRHGAGRSIESWRIPFEHL